MKRVALLIALLIACTACGGSKIFTTSNLPNILPGKNEAPPGLTFLPDSSGKEDLSLVATGPDEETKFKTYGFVGAYTTFYSNPAAVGMLQRQTTAADPGAHLLTMLGIVFKTSEGAHKALLLSYQTDVAGTNVHKLEVKKIGDETLAESGTQSGLPLPGFLIYWRIGNAIFAVFDAGGPTSGVSIDTAQKYAERMNARAQKI